ncbi:30757_t:CDS:1, partial [Gigaspora margarita]
KTFTILLNAFSKIRLDLYLATRIRHCEYSARDCFTSIDKVILFAAICDIDLNIV